MPATPVSLLERLRQPAQPEAWDRFVALYSPLLYSWSRRLDVPPAEAADLVQEVFLALLHALPEFRYDRHRSFRAWLLTVTRNKWAEINRRRLIAAAGPEPDALAVPDPLEQIAEAEYRQSLVQQALRLMQADFQPTTWKAFWGLTAEGRPAAAVAAELGLTPRAVYLAKARVLRRLRQELAGLLD